MGAYIEVSVKQTSERRDGLQHKQPCLTRDSTPHPTAPHKTIDNGPHNFEPQSSNENETRASSILSDLSRYVNIRAISLDRFSVHQPLYSKALDRFNVHRCPTRRVSSGTGLELVTRPATIRYLDPLATTPYNCTRAFDEEPCKSESQSSDKDDT
ncbi:hypothetical protein TNCV_1416831 [Trichonephila clavipes]|nr:hypothetical protein TNCV_1416831 [Trichonephila clavipes]